MNYRPEIDGLRAIAVLSVIVFHIDNAWLQSGFLGVDIFFVISGFLITSIIKTQMEQGKFSFIQFYKSRMKRILPAFLIFVFVISIIAKVLFLPQDFVGLIQSFEYALSFRANILFSFTADYFDVLASEKPFLHIWSLSIEEQFYFIFPLLLLFCIKYFPKYVKPFIVALILLSLSTYFWTTLDILNMDKYFLLRTRAYELLLGSLFACFSVREFKNNMYSWFFIVPMIVVLFLPKDMLIGDGYIERFIICLSTGGLILFQPKVLKRKEYYFLSMQPLVMIGLMSYSLYLWHWGILAVMRYVYMEYTLPNHYILIAITLMFGCAILSYRYVELPLKHIKTFSHHLFFALVFCYCALIWMVSTYHDNLKSQIIQPIYHHTTQEMINLDWDEETNCHDGIKPNWSICQKGDVTKTSNILMVGDSHAGQLNEFIDYMGKKEGWKADVISADNCRFFILAENPFTNFHDKCHLVYQYAKNHWQNYDIIIYAMYWYKTQTLPEFYQRFEKEVQLLTQQGKKVYIIRDNPAVNLVPLRMLRQNDLGIAWYAESKIDQNQEIANQKLEEIVKKYPQVYWIDIPKYIPNNLMLDGYPIYKDRDHLNPYGVKQLAIEFAKNEQFLR